MTAQDIRDMRELDSAAEEAGGYVIPPELVRHSKKFDEDFATMRQYCIKHGKKFDELTEEDYEIMDIRPF